MRTFFQKKISSLLDIRLTPKVAQMKEKMMTGAFRRQIKNITFSIFIIQIITINNYKDY